MSRRILVTGADGFIGRELCWSLEKAGHGVRRALWKPTTIPLIPKDHSEGPMPALDVVIVGDIGSDTRWSEPMNGIEVVVHLAARVHVMKETAADPLEAFRAVNLFGTERLARCAVEMGVQRMVYISTIGVNGNSTDTHPFMEENRPNPHDSYALSKWEAEQSLRRLYETKGLDVVIVRPPLVYGPTAPGNFGRLLRLIAGGFPLPLGSVRNKRSLISLYNLADFLVSCVEDQRARGQTFLISDGEDLSTAELIRRLTKALGSPDRLFPFPPPLLRVMAKAMGKAAEWERLCGSLQVDSSKARQLLGWKPPLSADEGLARVADWYKNQENLD